MRILSFFKSVKLAVTLILILAATSVIGTLIPQGRPPMYWVEKYGEGTYGILQFLGFLDLYHSGWFLFLILLLAVNILVCSLSRVRRTYRLTVWNIDHPHTLAGFRVFALINLYQLAHLDQVTDTGLHCALVAESHA